jgi:myosin heavy subunit
MTRYLVTLTAFLALSASAVPSATRPAAATQKVSEAERIEFLQKNVQAQMQELQERMFRLAELTRQAEPSDSAKLILALRRSREEMILEEMKDVMDLLGQKNLGHAVVQEQDVIKKLEKLKELLLSTDLDLQLALERIKKLQGAIAKLDTAIKEEKRESAKSGQMAKATTRPAKALAQHQQDQQQNRKTTEAVKQTVKELGEPVTAATPALSDATSAMSNAEAKLGSGKPGDAQPKQEEATTALQQARDQLEQQRQEMLAQIESQVKRQVIENLELMLEKQKTIREANEALLPRLQQQNREAAVRLKALAASETHIAELAESTAQLVEDTEFSFALPPNLRNIQRRALYVTADLTAGKGDQPVIVAERKIERDIADLLDTFKQSTIPSNKVSRCKGCKGDKNKLLAELKAIRLLQVRVNEETKELDDHRVAIKGLPKDLQDQIGDNRDHQATVRDTLDRLDAVVSGKPPTY